MKFLWGTLVLVGFLLIGCVQQSQNELPQNNVKHVNGGKVMKALMIIAPENFRDEELFHTKEELENAGIEVTVASKTPGEKTGMLGGKAMAEIALSDVDVSNYDAVVFVGGSGAQVYYTDDEALNIAKEAYKQGKVLGAICIAPGILAKAGVIKGKKATIWDGGDGTFKSIVEEGGATYTGEDVTVDGKIVTANGPHAARKFGKTIASMLG